MRIFTKGEVEVAQNALADFMYSHDLPFTTFANKEWNKFIGTVAPGFPTPNEHAFRGRLLDQTYEKSMEATLLKIEKADCVTLGIDECKLAGKSKRINFMVHLPEPLYLTSHEVEENASITAGYLQSHILNVIKTYELKVNAIISDNAQTIKKVRRDFEAYELTIATQSKPKLRVRCLDLYCLCHGINLIIRDLMNEKFVKERLAIAVGVANKLKSNSQLHSIYKEHADSLGVRVVKFNIPPEIRWLYYKEFLEIFLTQKKSIRAMFDKDYPRIVNLLSSADKLNYKRMAEDDYWIDLEYLVQAISPLCSAILLSESTRSTISDAYIVVSNIQENKHKYLDHLAKRQIDTQKISKMIDLRHSQIVSDHHKIAAVLDPRYRKDVIDKIEYREAKKYVQYAADILGFDDTEITEMNQDLRGYYVVDEPFDEDAYSSVNSTTDAIQWWKLYARKTMLSKLAIILMALPSSNASVERSFSHQGLIYTKKRQSMKHTQLDKLTKIKTDKSSGNTKSVIEPLKFTDIWSELEYEEIAAALNCDGDPTETDAEAVSDAN